MLDTAYSIGANRAEEDFLVKVSSSSFAKEATPALLAQGIGRGLSSLWGSAGSALGRAGASTAGRSGKFMLGFGGAPGTAARSASFWVGMPSTFGLLGAATAGEGNRLEGFGKGVLGGLLFNVGMRGGEKLIGAGLTKALGGGAGGKHTELFSKFTRGGTDAISKGGKNYNVGNFKRDFWTGSLTGAEKARRAAHATGTIVVGGIGGGMALSSLADPLADVAAGNYASSPTPMSAISNPFNPSYY